MSAPLAIAFAALLLLACHFVLRIAPLWRHRHQGCDAYYYLLTAEVFRRERRLPIVLPPYYLLEPQDQAYPPMTSVLLGLLPERWLARYYWTISPAIDALSMLIVAGWIGAEFGVAWAIAAGLCHSMNASLTLEFSSLNSRPLSLVLTNGFLLATFLWTQGWVAGFPAAVLLGAALLYTHKLSVQLLWFLAPFLALAMQDPKWLATLPAAYLLAFAVAPRLFPKVLAAHWDIIRFWHRNFPRLSAHLVKDSPIYGGSGEPAGYYAKRTLGSVVRQARKLLDYDCFVLAVPLLLPLWHELHAVERFAFWWVVGTFAWGAATFLLRPLRCVGEGNKYFKYALAPSYFSLVVALIAGAGIAAYAVAAFCALYTIYSYAATARGMRGPPDNVGRLTPEIAEMVERIKNMADARIVCLPPHLSDLMAYHTRRPVLWGGHNYELDRLEPFFPVILRPLPELAARHGITHLLLNDSYASLAELRLAHLRVVARTGHYQLVALAGA